MIVPETKLENLHYPVVTMGTFDGVHLGHQHLLSKVISRAKQMKGESVVITYYHHPKETLTSSLAPYLLTERHKKTSLLKQIGIDHIVYLQFDENMARMKAIDFLRKILLQKVNAREIVFGYDCHFGYQRQGDFHFLKDHEKRLNYCTHLIKPYKISGQIVSSSMIRNLIRTGEVSKAGKLLGRYYDLEGKVGKGSGIGRKIGFPTLNVIPSDPYKLLPANGVYLGKALLGGRELFCLTNIGYCPTLKQLDERTVESFLLGYENERGGQGKDTLSRQASEQKQIDPGLQKGELYNQMITVSFITRLRDEFRFPGKKSLIEAIRHDQEVAGKLIGKLQKNGSD